MKSKLELEIRNLIEKKKFCSEKFYTRQHENNKHKMSEKKIHFSIGEIPKDILINEVLNLEIYFINTLTNQLEFG